MSTILEALKKSEQERNRNTVPKLSDMPLPQENSRWPLIAVAVLSLVLALVLGILLSQWLSGSRPPVTLTPSASALQTPSGQLAPVGQTQISSSIGEASLSDIVVNVISYSEDASASFVMINGKLFRENDFVRAGLKVQEIQVDAVIFNHRGELIRRTP